MKTRTEGQRRKPTDPDTIRRYRLRQAAVTVAVVLGLLVTGGMITGAVAIGSLQSQQRVSRHQAAVQRHQAAVLRRTVAVLEQTVRRQHRAILANCGLNHDLGVAQLPPTAPMPSKFAVSIISDTRQAWHRLGCPGTLAPASRELLRLQHLYGIKPG